MVEHLTTPALAEALVSASALVLALLIDHVWGEPPARFHPVVWVGRYLNAAARWVLPTPDAPADPRDLKAFARGAALWTLGAALALAAGWGVQQAARALPGWLGAVLLGLALKPMLAWAMLAAEVRAVEAALAESLAAGRQRLALLVSRDTARLSATQVRQSAIESLAENLNDSVVAPLFWFALLGLPGAAVYRFANTADAMWGYPGLRHGQNWAWAGKWAARADDVLSWLPARVTALLLAGVTGRVTGGVKLAVLRREARKTPSPNSGWPMAAMALSLNVCLHKPGVYALNPLAPPPEAQHTAAGIKYASKVALVTVFIAFIAINIIAIIRDL